MTDPLRSDGSPPDTSPMDQQTLPMLDWPALKPGPVFLCFELWGMPGHKGRHRSRVVIPKEAWARSGGGQRYMTEAGVRRIFVQQYPDPKTAAYEKTLAEYAALMMRGRRPTENPVALLVHSFRPVPQSWSNSDKSRALAGNIRPTSRPDWDNHAKVTDALNGIVWRDDAQVVDGRSIKLYSESPALRVEVREMIEVPRA